MHFEKLYNKKNFLDNEIFNKKLNWFLDIKFILLRKTNLNNIKQKAIHLSSEYKKLILKKNKKKTFKIIINSKKKNLKYFYKNNKKRKEMIKSLNFLKKNKKYFKHFVIQGSLASNEFIDGWSDFDSFVVIKNSVILDHKQLIKLNYLLNKFYKMVKKFSPLQHHGIIVYTEYDLTNYQNGFLPPEALKNNFNLLNNEKISFNKILKSKKNISLKSLKERRKYIINGLKKGYYDHHVFHKKKMKIPLKIGDPTLLQLFSHIGYIINLPILFFDSLDKSIHKKKSFKKFYRIINDKKIIQFIKKHEKLRLEWNNINRNHKIISSSLINHLGKNYMYDCLKTLNKIIKKINQLKIPA